MRVDYLLLCVGWSVGASSSTFGYNYTASPGCNYPATLTGYSTYTEYGPYCWGSYDSTCAGSSQSPININLAEAAPSSYHALEFKTTTCMQAEFYNDGHTWVMDTHHTCHGAHEVDFSGGAYELEHISFHSPSEHTIGGYRYGGEVQLVHKSLEGAYLILSVLLEDVDDELSRNSFLDFIWGIGDDPTTGRPNNVTGDWTHYHSYHNTTITSRQIDPYSEIIPSSPQYYAYTGSFTDPPCTESVQWVIMKQPSLMSKSQAAYFRKGLAKVHGNITNIDMPGQYANNRPVRPTNGRHVYHYLGMPHSAHHEEHAEHHTSDTFFYEMLTPLASVVSFVGFFVLTLAGAQYVLSFLALEVQAIYHYTVSTRPSKELIEMGQMKFKPLNPARIRGRLLRAIIMSLEILVAADVLDTLVTPIHYQTYELLGLIGLVVAIRTALGMHLAHEVEELKLPHGLAKKKQ